MVLTGRRMSGGDGGTESVSDHPSPRALGSGGRAATRSDRRIISSALILSQQPRGWWIGYYVLHLRRVFVVEL